MRYPDLTPSTPYKLVEPSDIPGEPPKVVDSTYTVVKLIRWALRHDRRLNSDGPGIHAAFKIAQELDRIEALPKLDRPSYAKLEDADHKILAEALETPQPMNGAPSYEITPAYQLHPLKDAVVSAPKEEPGAAARPVEASSTKPPKSKK